MYKQGENSYTTFVVLHRTRMEFLKKWQQIYNFSTNRQMHCLPWRANKPDSIVRATQITIANYLDCRDNVKGYEF